jgi:hypothetical protein
MHPYTLFRVILHAHGNSSGPWIEIQYTDLLQTVKLLQDGSPEVVLFSLSHLHEECPDILTFMARFSVALRSTLRSPRRPFASGLRLRQTLTS